VGALQGVYTFSSLQDFQAGRYVTFQQAFGVVSQFQNNPNLGLFAQDEWKPRADLTINAGLRYDAQFLPAPIQTDSNNFASRLGLAYAPRFLGRHQRTATSPITPDKAKPRKASKKALTIKSKTLPDKVAQLFLATTCCWPSRLYAQSLPSANGLYQTLSGNATPRFIPPGDGILLCTLSYGHARITKYNGLPDIQARPSVDFK
jgi:hypothetical protein